MPQFKNTERDDALKMWKAKGYPPAEFEASAKQWEAFDGDWTNDFTFFTWYDSVKDISDVSKAHAAEEAKAPDDVRQTTQYKTLIKTSGKIDAIHERLKLALETLGDIPPTEKAKNQDVQAIYKELRSAELALKTNINQKYQNPAQAVRDAKKYTLNRKGYEQFLKDRPFKQYTTGTKGAGITATNISAIETGTRYEPLYKKKAFKTKEEEDANNAALAHTEAQKKAREQLAAIIKSEKKAKMKNKKDGMKAPEMQAPGTGKPQKLEDADPRTKRDDETDEQYIARMLEYDREQKAQREQEKEQKKQNDRDEIILTRAIEDASAHTDEMEKTVQQYITTNESGDVVEIRKDARAALLAEYGTMRPRGMSDTGIAQLMVLYLHKAIQAKSTQDGIATGDNPDTRDGPQENPNLRGAGSGGTTHNVPVITDQDGDGDVDRDDYYAQHGGIFGNYGHTKAEIAEGVIQGQQQLDAEKGYEQYKTATGRQDAKTDPNATESTVGTVFAGDMAGIDQEVFYNDPPPPQAPQQAQQAPQMTIKKEPATDFKTSVLQQFEHNTEDEGQRMEDATRQTKTVQALKQEIECFHLLYGDKIQSINDPEHKKLYAEALGSNSLKDVRAHHKLMSDIIRAYYKVAHLKLGVILSAESVFGGSVGNIPSMAGSFGLGVPIQRGNEKPTRIDRKKGKDRYSNATAGEINVIRGGRNSKKGVRQAIPRDLDKNKYIDDIPYPNYEIADAFRPRSYMRRRAHINPEVKLKSRK